jgi:hypothetical protein
MTNKQTFEIRRAASGAIGRPLIAELVRQGHAVAGMTHSEAVAQRNAVEMSNRSAPIRLRHGSNCGFWWVRASRFARTSKKYQTISRRGQSPQTSIPQPEIRISSIVIRAQPGEDNWLPIGRGNI